MGIDIELFININEHLICPICLDVFDDPAMAPCGHNCCTECWYSLSRGAPARARQHTMPCPICRAQIPAIPIGSMELFVCIATTTDCLKKNRLITQMIDDWPTKCVWKDCSEHIKYSERGSHARSCTHRVRPVITIVPACETVLRLDTDRFWCDQCYLNFSDYSLFRDHIYGDHDLMLALEIESLGGHEDTDDTDVSESESEEGEFNVTV